LSGESISLSIYKEGEKTDCSDYRDISLLSTTYIILVHILLSRLTHMQRKILGIIIVDFNTAGQLMTTYSGFVILENKWEYNEAVRELFIDFKKA